MLNHITHRIDNKIQQNKTQQEKRAKKIIKEAKAHAKNNPESYVDEWYIPDLIEQNYDCHTLSCGMSDGNLDVDRVVYSGEFETKLKTSFVETKNPQVGSIVTYRRDGYLNHSSIYLGNGKTFAKPGNVLPPHYSNIGAESSIYGK